MAMSMNSHTSLFSDISNSHEQAPRASPSQECAVVQACGKEQCGHGLTTTREREPTSNVATVGTDEEARREMSCEVVDRIVNLVGDGGHDMETSKNEPGELNQADSNPPPTTVRFVNNPHGTPLATIIEQQSYATLGSASAAALDSASNPPRPKVRKRISKSFDEAALREFRGIFACNDTTDTERSHLSSCPSSDHAEKYGHFGRAASPVYGPAFARSGTPPTGQSWPSDRDLSCTSRGLTEQNSPNRFSAKAAICAVRDFFRTTTPAQHGQTAFSQDFIQSSSVARRQWRPPRNSFNHHGQHPFHGPNVVQSADLPTQLPPQKGSESSSESSGYAECACASNAAEDGQFQAPAPITPVKSHPPTQSIRHHNNEHEPDWEGSTIRVVEHSPLRLSIKKPFSIRANLSNSPKSPKTPSKSPTLTAGNANQRNSLHVRFEDFPLPPNLITSASTPRKSEKSVRTFRSAALSALLPIAAAEGIVRRVVVVSHPTPSPPPTLQPSPPPSPSPAANTSLELSRLFHCGNVCEHLARRCRNSVADYEEQAYIQALEHARVDGAYEFDEKRDMCWKCKVTDTLRSLSTMLCFQRESNKAVHMAEGEKRDRGNDA